MKETGPVLKQAPRPEKLATTSIISALVSWVCLVVLVLLVNAQMGVTALMASPLIVLCLLLIIVLPLNAIVSGARAVQVGAKLTAGKKAQAWAGIYLAGFLYIVAVGYWWLALRITQ